MKRFFDFKWQDQVGGLSSEKIKEGFAKFKTALLESDDEKKIDTLKKIAQENQSYHAATYYCGIRLQTSLTKTENFLERLLKVLNWFFEVAKVHGSPAFYYMASIYFQFAEIEQKTNQ